MRNLDSLLVEYCEHLVNTYHRCGYSGQNIIHRILKDPGISTQGSKHKILYWPRNKRIAKMSRAFHHLDAMQQICLIVRFGRIVDPDNGQVVDDVTFAQDQPGMTLPIFHKNIRSAKYKLAEVLR